MSHSPLRIALLVTNDISQDQRMHRIAKTLSEMGLEVELIGRWKKNSLPLEKQIYQTKRLKLPFEKGPFFYLSYNIAAFRYLWKTRPHIVYAVDLDSLAAGALFKRLRSGVRLIFDAHEYFTEVPELKASPIKKRIWSAIASLGIPLSDLCLTVGPALAQIFSNKYGQEFHSIRNLPTAPGATRKDYRPENKILLYQGVLNEGRGLEYIIEAMEFLEDWTLWLVGRGDIEDRLKSMARKSPAAERILFIGFIQPDKLHKYTTQATLGLNLLVADSLSYYYSLANKTFDYMAFGIPAVHMDFPEYRALQDEHHCFLLLESLQTRTFVELIQSLNVAELKSLHENNLSASVQFSWSKESEKLKKLLKTLY